MKKMTDAEKWFEKQTNKVKRAVIRRMTRPEDKAQRKTIFAITRSRTGMGYCCPKCHVWYPTPEDRRECRINHAKLKEVIK